MEKIYKARKTVFGAISDLKALGQETEQTTARAVLDQKTTEVDALFDALTAKAKEMENAAFLYHRRKAEAEAKAKAEAEARRNATTTTTTTSTTSSTQVSTEGSECVVCMDKPRTILLTRCRHMCLCAECVQKIGDLCPICRTPFTATNVVSVLMP